MSNIDKHAVQAVADLKAGYTLGHADVAILNELARIALASLEAEAVGEVVLGEFDDAGCHPDARVACIAANGQADWENFKDGTRLYTAPPATVSVPDECYQHLSELYHAQEKRLFKLAQRIKGPDFDKYAHSTSQAIDVLESAIFGESAEEDSSSAMLQGDGGNSPVIPDGWVMLPAEPTQAMMNAWLSEVANWRGHAAGYRAMIAAAPQHEAKNV
ncbi:hypothetical protein P3S30_25445 [Enterobacter hormaechei]|uniref:hypothetical protein n=1 Tax=Enterobacter hormaechei TaxID=158836 RepID=UPI0023E3C605|nr:hypothetical protein [Enterobacter hormaechei]MDF3711707.1 hypothetical protein [Enterobacter hormaechei]